MKQLLVSFSGGETSAYMCYYVKKRFSLEWSKEDNCHIGTDPNTNEEIKVIFVFANTGQENEETLIFTDRCDKYFDLNLVWVEAEILYKFKIGFKTFIFNTERLSRFKGLLRKFGKVGKRAFNRMFEKLKIGTSFNVTDFKNAHRGHRLFEEMIMKYGIPNQAYPHCNRELKLAPIKSYMFSIGWKDYWTAIGIRNDEIDRVNKDRKKNKLYYPMVLDQPMTKQKINFWWSVQPFRLNLKHWEGNCVWCWKKGFKKLVRIAQDNRRAFDVPLYLENKYKRFIPESRDRNIKGQNGFLGIFFFRNNTSVKWILDQADKRNDVVIKDDSAELNYQTSLFDYEESCDIFAECGIDN